MAAAGLFISAHFRYMREKSEAVGRPHPVFALVANPVQFRVGFKVLDAFAPSGRGLLEISKRRFQFPTEPPEKQDLHFRNGRLHGPGR